MGAEDSGPVLKRTRVRDYLRNLVESQAAA